MDLAQQVRQLDETLADSPRWENFHINFPGGVYIVLERIAGRGITSVAWEASRYDTSNPDAPPFPVCVKLQRLHGRLPPKKRKTSRPFRDETRQTFSREVNVLNGFVKTVQSLHRFPDFYGSAIVGSRLCIFMQMLPETAIQSIQNSPPHAAFDRALHLCRDLCNAVSSMHGGTKPLLHNDIKPSNFMVDTDGRGVVIDFGLWCSLDYASKGGHFFGTPKYAAPEKQNFLPFGVASDVYSLGKTCTELLVAGFCVENEWPFEDESVETTPESIISQGLANKAVHDKMPWEVLPMKLRLLLARGISGDPELRPTSEEMAEEFKLANSSIQSASAV